MVDNKPEWKDHPANCQECPYLENKNPFCELGNERWLCTLKKVKMPRLSYPPGIDNTKEIRKNCYDRVRPGTTDVVQDKLKGEGTKVVKSELKNEVVKCDQKGLFKWLT